MIRSYCLWYTSEVGGMAWANRRAMCKTSRKKETSTLSRDSAIFGPRRGGGEVQVVGVLLERRGDNLLLWIGQSFLPSFCRRLVPMLPPFRHESPRWIRGRRSEGESSESTTTTTTTSSMKRNEATEKHAPPMDGWTDGRPTATAFFPSHQFTLLSLSLSLSSGPSTHGLFRCTMIIFRKSFSWRETKPRVKFDSVGAR